MLVVFKRNLTQQPEFLFLLTAIILVISTSFMWRDTLDLHLHGTYYIISAKYFIWGLSLVFVIVWGIYQLTNKILWTRKLVWFHVLATLFIFALLPAINLWYSKLVMPIKNDIISFHKIVDEQQRERIIALTILIIFIIVQLAYFINLIVGLFKRKFSNYQQL